jgi:hypothetical protein
LFFSATPVVLPADLSVKQPAVNQGMCEIFGAIIINPWIKQAQITFSAIKLTFFYRPQVV